MVTNTLRHYDIGAIYSPDEIFDIFKQNDLLQYADIATEQGNVQNLNAILDFGAKPLSQILSPMSNPRVIDRPNPADLEKAKKKNVKKMKSFSDLTYLPPRPTKQLEVLTYAECQPKFVIRTEQLEES